MEHYFKRVGRVSETQSQRLPVSADSNSGCSLSDFQSACSESPAQLATSTEEFGLASVSSDPLTFPDKPHQPRLTSFPALRLHSVVDQNIGHFRRIGLISGHGCIGMTRLSRSFATSVVFKLQGPV